MARVPVRAFVNPENRLMVYRKEKTRRFAGPAFLLNEMLVWGFTGQVISAMLDVAGWAKPWNTDDVRELDEAMALVGGTAAATVKANDDIRRSGSIWPSSPSRSSLPSPAGAPGALGRCCPSSAWSSARSRACCWRRTSSATSAAPRTKLFVSLFLILGAGGDR